MQMLKTASNHEPLVSIKQGVAIVYGDWSVQALSIRGETARRVALLKKLPQATQWDISHMGRLDTIGGQLLWDNWGGQKPLSLVATPGQTDLLDKVASGQSNKPLPKPATDWLAWVVRLGEMAQIGSLHARLLAGLLGQLLIDLLACCVVLRRVSWARYSAQLAARYPPSLFESE